MWARIKSLKLGARIVVLTLGVLTLVVLANYFVFIEGFEGSAMGAMVDRAAAFTAVADEAKNHVSRLNTGQAFDYPALLEGLRATIDRGESYWEAKIFSTIPVVAGWEAAGRAASCAGESGRVAKEGGEVVSQTIRGMRAGKEQVQAGVHLATEAGQSLRHIVARAQEVSGMIQSIAAAAQQQSSASEEVSRNVESISGVTRQAGEGAKQAAEAAVQLSARAERLRTLVTRFKIETNGGTLAGKSGEVPQARSIAEVLSVQGGGAGADSGRAG